MPHQFRHVGRYAVFFNLNKGLLMLTKAEEKSIRYNVIRECHGIAYIPTSWWHMILFLRDE